MIAAADAPDTADTPPTARAIESIYRRDGRRVFATLVRLLGDFDLAEEALHDAFRVALENSPPRQRPGSYLWH